MHGKDSVNKVGQHDELAQQLLKQVRDAVLDDREIEMTDQFRSSFKWLPRTAEPGKTLAHTIFDAITERNLGPLRQHQLSASMPKRSCVDIYRRLAFHFGYVVDTPLSGPKLYDKFKDGWSVLAAWAAVTDTALVILDKTETPVLAKTVSHLTQTGLSAMVIPATEQSRKTTIEKAKARHRALMALNVNDVVKIANQFSSGSSQSSWKHYRTDGLRLVFDAAQMIKVKRASIRNKMQSAIPVVSASVLPAPDPSAVASTIVPLVQESLHDLCRIADHALTPPKLIKRPEMIALQEKEQALVFGNAGNGCTTTLKYLVREYARQGLLDAIYIDLAEPRLSPFVTNLPRLVAEALRPLISTTGPNTAQELQEEIRRALAAGWLKLFLDNSDGLTPAQLNTLLDVLPTVPKWALAIPRELVPNRWLFRESAIPQIVLGPPFEAQVKGYIRHCVPKSTQGQVAALLQQHNWLQQTWLALSTGGEAIGSGSHTNTTQIAERYWHELLQRSHPQHAADEMVKLLGELTLTQIFVSEATVVSGLLTIRLDWAELFADKLSLPIGEVDVCLRDWAHTAFLYRVSNGTSHLSHRECAAILGGIGYAHWYANDIVSLFRSTNEVQWHYCVPRAIEYLENHRQEDVLERFCFELNETCIASRRHLKTEAMISVELHAARCLTHMSAELLAQNEWLKQYIGDAFEQELLRLLPLNKGLISKMLLNLYERDAYLEKLIVNFAGFDPQRLAQMGNDVLSHPAARKDQFAQNAGNQMIVAAKKPAWHYRF